jgi:hypothetical protein
VLWLLRLLIVLRVWLRRVGRRRRNAKHRAMVRGLRRRSRYSMWRNRRRDLVGIEARNTRGRGRNRKSICRTLLPLLRRLTAPATELVVVCTHDVRVTRGAGGNPAEDLARTANLAGGF